MSMTSPARLSATERREQVLNVALAVFAQRGYHTTSMNDIADAAGVTKPVLYQHFDSKRALYIAVLEAVGEGMITAIGSATKATPSGKTQTAVGMVAYFTWVANDPNGFSLLFGGGTRRDEEFATVARKIETAAAELIAPLIEAGVDADYQRMVAHALIGMSEGVSRHLIQQGAHIDADVVGEQLASLAWAGLRAVGRKPEQR
jgi:AcrR family transcriptional regulator